MSARDSLAAELAEHMPSIKNAANTSGWCPVCVQWLRDDAFAAHQADVALAWMAENGWVQGREEWGVQYERYADPTMGNPSGEVTNTMILRDEQAVREVIRRKAPISGRNRRAVRRTVTDWEKA